MMESTRKKLQEEHKYLLDVHKQLMDIGAVQKEQTWLAYLYKALKESYEAGEARRIELVEYINDEPPQGNMATAVYRQALDTRERVAMLYLPSDAFRESFRRSSKQPINDLFVLMEDGSLEVGHLEAISAIIVLTDKEAPVPEKEKIKRGWIGYAFTFFAGLIVNDFVMRGGLKSRFLGTKKEVG